LWGGLGLDACRTAHWSAGLVGVAVGATFRTDRRLPGVFRRRPELPAEAFHRPASPPFCSIHPGFADTSHSNTEELALIYAALTFWLMLLILVGIGVYRLWAGLGRANWVNWALLPGTVVSEMGYIFGCLITGGEVRRAKLMRQSGETGDDGEPTAELSGGVRYIGPILAALVSIVACVAAVILVHKLLGGPVVGQFITGDGMLSLAALPKQLPTTWDLFWDQVSRQVMLLRRMCETLARLDWLDWRVPLFVYVSLCLAVRLSPTGRPVRPTLAAAAAVSVVIAVVGLVWPGLSSIVQDVWPLLTYLWASLLLALVVTGLALGLGYLVKIIVGKQAG